MKPIYKTIFVWQHIFILDIFKIFMEFDSVVRRRRSAHSFLKKRASWKAVLDAVEAANYGPFAGNLNNLRFLIIEEEETIAKVAKHAEQTWIGEAGIIVIVCSDETTLEDKYGERGRVYSRQQAGAAIETFILKLADLGLGSCWVGAYSDELLKEVLKIPQHIQIEAVIPVGYEDKKSYEKKPKKKELENSIYWENWGNGKRPTIFKEPIDPMQFKR